MATNKQATIRYLTLDKCFSNRQKRFSFEDLLLACNDAIRYLNPESAGIKRRQLYDDIDFMQSDAGWQIELDKLKEGRLVFYRYSDPDFSINKSALNSTEAAQLSEVVNILARFRGMPQFEWMDELVTKLESNFGLRSGATKIIDFDENRDYTAVRFISPLFNAILERRILKVTYKSFKQKEKEEFGFHPYFLKQYNNRWFCFGYREDAKKISNLALDRLLLLKSKTGKYKENNVIDFNEYFEDIIGVTIRENGKVEEVILAVDKELWPYIETKPLHGTQKLDKSTKDKKWQKLSIKIIPNYELETLLLSFGEKIQVLQPAYLKEKLMKRKSIVYNND